MAEEKKFYLSEQGLERMKKEYRELKKFKLAKEKEELPEIWHSEDLDSEHLFFQKDPELLAARLVELKEILKNAKLIKIPSTKKQNIIGLGAKVKVEVDCQSDEFKIVGTLEADPSLGNISNESPVGKALLGHRVGDEVVVSSPIKTVYKIKRIKY